MSNIRIVVLFMAILVISLSQSGFGATIEWFESFEGDWENDWYVDAGTWEVGHPTSGPGKAFEGDNCAATVLAGNYASSVDSRLIKRKKFIVPAASENPRLRFWHWYSIGEGDFSEVQIKPTNGEWTPIPDYKYHEHIATSSGVWTFICIDLSEYENQEVQIAFRMYATYVNHSNNCSTGWYVDNVQLQTGEFLLNDPETWANGIGDWSVAKGVWEVGVPTAGPSTTPSDKMCAGTVLNGKYHSRAWASLVSPMFTVAPTNDGTADLFFRHWYEFGVGDYGMVVIAVDTGWIEESVHFTGSSSGIWSPYIYPLDDYIGQEISVTFFFSASYQNHSNDVSYGWYVDDIDLPMADAHKFAASPQAITFPNTEITHSSEKSFTVTNLSNANLQLSLDVTGENSDSFSLENNSVSLSDSESATLQVTFAPNAEQSYHANISVSDGTDNISISLTGAGITIPELAVNPGLIDFGQVLNSKTENLLLSNIGTGTVEINSFQFTSDASSFHVPFQNLTISSGEQKTVPVTFKPIEPRKYNTKLIMTGNAGLDTVNIVGVGIEGDPRMPNIRTIVDVPNDQGNKVLVIWFPSQLDSPASDTTITHYSLWRRVDNIDYFALQGNTDHSYLNFKDMVDNHGQHKLNETCLIGASETGATVDSKTDTTLWTYVNLIPANQSSRYSVVAETIFDSTIVNGMHWSVFRLIAHTANAHIWFASLPDSGYSLDNLAPSIPSHIQVSETAEGVNIVWEEAQDEDLDYYNIYRSATGQWDDVPVYRSTTFPNFVDTGVQKKGTYYYKISAVDFSGNESEPSPPVKIITMVKGFETKPQDYALLPNYPNPFNPMTTLEYEIPKNTHVTLTILNSLGQNICTLVNEQKEAGHHSINWDAQNETGEQVSSGIYLYRLSTDEFSQTRKMMFLR